MNTQNVVVVVLGEGNTKLCSLGSEGATLLEALWHILPQQHEVDSIVVNVRSTAKEATISSPGGIKE